MPDRRWLACGLLIVAGACIPVLGAGFGADPDAWLVAAAAAGLWKTGHYAVSRFPGYPLHEIVSAPLVGLGGCTLSNAGTLLAALVLTILWFRLSSDLGKNPLTLFFSLICAPIVLTNAAATMDYLWSLALLLAALEAALRKREILAGLLTGAAAGFRPSNLTIALALFVFISLRTGRGAGFRYLAAAACAAAAAFLPVMVTYGGPFRWIALTHAEMSDVHPAPAARVLEFGYRSIYALGPLAFAALTMAAWKGRTALRVLVRERDPLIVASIIAAGIMTLQFFALPLERSYLLPAIPFALLIADRVSTPRMSMAILLCIISMNVFNPDVARHEPSGTVFAPGLREGRLAESWRERELMIALHSWPLPYTPAAPSPR